MKRREFLTNTGVALAAAFLPLGAIGALKEGPIRVTVAELLDEAHTILIRYDVFDGKTQLGIDTRGLAKDDFSREVEMRSLNLLKAEMESEGIALADLKRLPSDEGFITRYINFPS